MVTGLFGSKNEFQAKPTQLDASAYQYGGNHGGTEAADAERYRTLAQNAESRQGPQLQTANADQARALAMQGRGDQQAAMGLSRQAALGNAPSVAAIQQQQGLDQAMRNQYALAGSARGPGALANAQYNAAQNAGAMAQQGVNQAASLRASEMAQARNDYASQASGIRSADVGQQQADFSQANAQAQLEAGQRALNDQYSLGQYQNEQAVRDAGLKAAMAMQAQQSANQQAADQINAGVAQQNAAQNNSNGGSLLSAAGSIAGMAAMSDARTKTNIQPEIYDAPTVSGVQANGGPTPFIPPNDKKDDYGFSANFSPSKGGVGGLESGARAAGGVNANVGGPKSGQGAAALMPLLQGLMGGGKSGASAPAAGASHISFTDTGGNAVAASDSISGGLGEGLAEGAMSDRRAKRGEHPQGAAPAEMLDLLEPFSFHYKPGTPGEDPAPKRFGVMAQDLQKSPMGASVVIETPAGLMIDNTHAPGVLFAALANVNDRLRELEAKKSGKGAR